MNKFISKKNVSNELEPSEINYLNKNQLKFGGNDIRNKTEIYNIDDIILFFNKKNLLNSLLNDNIDIKYKINLLDTLDLNKNSIKQFNMSEGGLYKDWD